MPEPQKTKVEVAPELFAALPGPLQKFLSDGKTEIRADDGDWIVSIAKAPGYLSRSLPAGAVVIANNGCGDHLFLIPDPSTSHLLQPKVLVFWHEGPSTEVFSEVIGTLVDPPPPVVTHRPPVLYHDGQTTVELGDEVTARNFFRRRSGRIIYVPGISKKNRDLEHGGLGWVLIAFADGSRIGTIVDPETSCLKKSVHFVKHSTGGFEEFGPNERLE